ncbi:serine/threonine-protein kinase pim-1-like [Agelaius phoeniceus]|uniref:serine/threonine-protein kinase pim-1-like n=1 Tax=Agelaius phoeniceus TaxID=39638 RepID=UPI004054B705
MEQRPLREPKVPWGEEAEEGPAAAPAQETKEVLPFELPQEGTAPEALQERYRLGSLLGRGGFGSVFAATRLSDGAPVAIKRVPRNRVRHWGELPDGSRAPLEIVLQAKVSTGFPGVVQFLEWFELPNHIVMVLERPERCQDLQRVIRARRFVPEEVARELFRQVLEAVWHCTSCGVLHRDIKPGNIVLDLATGQAKLIDFGCGTYLQETAYTHFAGGLSSPIYSLYRRDPPFPSDLSRLPRDGQSPAVLSPAGDHGDIANPPGPPGCPETSLASTGDEQAPPMAPMAAPPPPR